MTYAVWYRRTRGSICFGVALIGCLSFGAAGVVESRDRKFEETWKRAKVRTFKPKPALRRKFPTLIKGNEGRWILNDTVSEFEDCGPTPHRATIVRRNGNKRIRLTSGVSSEGGCSDNVWLEWRKDRVLNKHHPDVLLTPGTTISFTAAGALDNASDPSTGCHSPPCGDHVALVVIDSNRNGVAYLLAYHPERQPDERDNYREIFLDATTGRYVRNLYDDFAALPDFRSGTTVQFIILQIDEHGWVELDDLGISPAE